MGNSGLRNMAASQGYVWAQRFAAAVCEKLINMKAAILARTCAECPSAKRTVALNQRAAISKNPNIDKADDTYLSTHKRWLSHLATPATYLSFTLALAEDR